MREILSMPHVVFGIFGMITAIWIIVEALNVTEKNIGRIKNASILTAVFIWISYLIGGWWYVRYYAADKAIIKAGPWPWAHGFVMEFKEHLFFILLMLATYLPILVYNSNILANKKVRNLVIITCAFIGVLVLAMEGFGSLIAMGVRMGLVGGAK